MGVDLTLLPFDCDFPAISFSHSILQLERRRELWGPIEEIEKATGRDVSEDFTTYLATGKDGETCYGKTPDTPYGNPLKYVTAGDLKPLANHEAVRDNFKNRAIWAYLAELPDDLKIALYWC